MHTPTNLEHLVNREHRERQREEARASAQLRNDLQHVVDEIEDGRKMMREVHLADVGGDVRHIQAIAELRGELQRISCRIAELVRQLAPEEPRGEETGLGIGDTVRLASTASHLGTVVRVRKSRVAVGRAVATVRWHAPSGDVTGVHAVAHLEVAE